MWIRRVKQSKKSLVVDEPLLYLSADGLEYSVEQYPH